MVRIRLRRVGARNQASFRIVAADKQSPRDGRFLEILGHYNPRTEPSTVVVDEARLFHWMEHGAQPSDAVVKALRSLGTWDRWDRYKSGEDLDTLVSEAEVSQMDVDQRTRRDDLTGTRKKKSKKKAAEESEKTDAPAAKAESKAEEAAPAEEEAEAVEEPVSEATTEEPEAAAEEPPETPEVDEPAAEAKPESESDEGEDGEDEPESALEES